MERPLFVRANVLEGSQYYTWTVLPHVLTQEDWDTLALAASQRGLLPAFGAVSAADRVSNGFAEALLPYASAGSEDHLLAAGATFNLDTLDRARLRVWGTGIAQDGDHVRAITAFSYCALPRWVTAIWTLG